MTKAAAPGDTVHVHYTGKLDDGTVFDSSRKREPLEFTIGAGGILPGFEEAVTGLEPGQTASAHIPAAEGYGERDDQRVINVPREQLPAGMEPQIGQKLQMKGDGGQTMVVTVTQTNDEAITLDANHPLAGKDLSFEIELVSIE